MPSASTHVRYRRCVMCSNDRRRPIASGPLWSNQHATWTGPVSTRHVDPHPQRSQTANLLAARQVRGLDALPDTIPHRHRPQWHATTQTVDGIERLGEADSAGRLEQCLSALNRSITRTSRSSTTRRVILCSYSLHRNATPSAPALF